MVLRVEKYHPLVYLFACLLTCSAIRRLSNPLRVLATKFWRLGALVRSSSRRHTSERKGDGMEEGTSTVMPGGGCRKTTSGLKSHSDPKWPTVKIDGR